MEDKISIIVPVYNMEKYLDRCMQSLVEQEHTNIEIILIDDGSTDASPAMCDMWQEKDDRVRIIHKKNGGQCTARNLGLDIATGNYIAFVDSDDYVSPSIYRCLLADLTECGADISCCASTNGTVVRGNGMISIFTNDEAMREHPSDASVVGQSPCDKLFKKELFNGIRFPLFRAYEDCATIYKLLAKAKKTVYRNLTLYHYIPRENSTMTQSFSAVKFLQIEAYWLMYQDYCRDYPQYADIVKGKLIGSCQYCIGESYKLKKHKELSDEIKKTRDKLKQINSKGLSAKMKMMRRMMVRFPLLFGMVYRIMK